MAETDNDEQPIPLPEEEDRPTLGARIAGIMQPSYMPGGSRAMPAPIDNSPAPGVKPALDMSKMPDAVKMLTGPASIPTPPTGSNNPQLADLARKQATLSAPINPVDPATHKTKPEYRMGIGSRILGAVADFGAGFNGRPAPVYIGPGATNQRFAREEAQRQGELSGVDTQIKTQEKLDATNNKLYEDATRQAYEGQLGQARLETAQAQQSKADTASQLADIKQLATNNQFKEAQAKLEEQAKRNEDMLRMGQGNLDLKRQMGELAIQMKQQQLEDARDKFATGVDAKSLEAERKQRLTAIEDDWKQHPFLNKLFGDKNKEIKAVNDDINSRLQGAGVAVGSPSNPTQPAGNRAPATPANQRPTPQTHGWSRSAWQRANPNGNVQAAEKVAKLKGFPILP
jgi:hypothetical protein